MKSVLKTLATSPVVAAFLFVIGCIVISATGLDAQIYKWSQTAGTNATADPNINWAEGQSPSSVNDSARAMMAALAEARDDWSGSNSNTSGSTSSAYTVTSNQGFDTLAHLNNQQICFTAPSTNAAGVTLSVDTLTAWPIDTSPNQPIGAGVMVQGTPYCVVYNNSNQQFYLRDFAGNPFNVPLGSVQIYTGSTTPSSNFIFPSGQCISRTTYATYFALVGTQYGNCDGVSTFGVPDLRGRVVAGLDNLGGSDAGRLAACGSVTTNGFACGADAETLLAGNIPQVTGSYTPAGTFPSGGTIGLVNGAPGGTFGAASGAGATFYTTSSLNWQGITFSGTPATITVGTGSPAPVNTVQPMLALTFILRVL